MVRTTSYRIATIPGDGISPEVMRADALVLNALDEARRDLNLEFIEVQACDRTKAETGGWRSL